MESILELKNYISNLYNNNDISEDELEDVNIKFICYKESNNVKIRINNLSNLEEAIDKLISLINETYIIKQVTFTLFNISEFPFLKMLENIISLKFCYCKLSPEVIKSLTNYNLLEKVLFKKLNFQLMNNLNPTKKQITLKFDSCFSNILENLEPLHKNIMKLGYSQQYVLKYNEGDLYVLELSPSGNVNIYENTPEFKFIDTFNPIKLYIGNSKLCPRTINAQQTEPIDMIGASCLLQLGETNYVYVGRNIFSFETSIQITSFESMCDNENVIYAYATDDNGNYILLMNEFCELHSDNLNVDPYECFDNKVNTKSLKSFKTKSNWEHEVENYIIDTSDDDSDNGNDKTDENTTVDEENADDEENAEDEETD